jgi:serine/threonine protein kinase
MELIGNKYKCIGKLGQGGYGSIYKYINIRTKEEVAVKVESKNETKLLKNETIIYQYLKQSVFVLIVCHRELTSLFRPYKNYTSTVDRCADRIFVFKIIDTF